MNAIVIGSIIGSALSLVLWPITGLIVRPRLADEPVVHRALVYLVIASFMLIDLFAFAIVGHGGATLISSLFAFATGLQVVAAIAAIIFIRRLKEV